MSKLIHVAVGVIVNADGKILIAKRPQTAHQGGLWEFPGGKVDAGETIEQALVRELREELAITVKDSRPLIQIRHHYPDKSVLLDVHKITRFEGNPIGNEGQPVQWVAADMLKDFQFPEANKPIISAINLPEKYVITGEYKDLPDFISRLELALTRSIPLMQLRIARFSFELHQAYLQAAIVGAKKAGTRLVINCSHDEFTLIKAAYPDDSLGLHLNQFNVGNINRRPVDSKTLFGISCHTAAEILRAQELEADYILLSPVLPTRSHPGAATLGWAQFSSLVELANIPVYALGGMGEIDIPQAQSCGAQGVAGISIGW